MSPLTFELMLLRVSTQIFANITTWSKPMQKVKSQDINALSSLFEEGYQSNCLTGVMVNPLAM